MIEIELARILELRIIERMVCGECKIIIRKRLNIVLDEMLIKYDK